MPVLTRSSMTETRLNNVLLLHTHKEMCDELDLVEIAGMFVSANSRRKSYFGSFTYLSTLLT